MLSFLRRGRRWFTAAIVIGVGGVFVLYMGVGGPIEGGRSAGNWITVGPYGFGAREFEQSRIQREEQLKQALGDNFDARAMRATIDQMATNVIVQRAVLAIEAEHQGLVVATKEIERSILDVPGFRGPDNRFDRQLFSDWVEYNYGNERNFMRDQRTHLLAEKMLTFMRSNAAVTDDEARLSVRQRLEEVRIGFVALDAGEAPEDFEPEEIQVDAFLEARESEARDLYSQRNATFNVPEQVRARHILFRVDKDADEEAVDAARKKAEIAIVRLEEEEFADLAEEISDDVGSKLEGGDLGFFGRGQVVEAGRGRGPAGEHQGEYEAEHQDAEAGVGRPDDRRLDLVHRPVDGGRGDQHADRRAQQAHPQGFELQHPDDSPASHADGDQHAELVGALEHGHQQHVHGERSSI